MPVKKGFQLGTDDLWCMEHISFSYVLLSSLFIFCDWILWFVVCLLGGRYRKTSDPTDGCDFWGMQSHPRSHVSSMGATLPKQQTFYQIFRKKTSSRKMFWGSKCNHFGPKKYDLLIFSWYFMIANETFMFQNADLIGDQHWKFLF